MLRLIVGVLALMVWGLAGATDAPPGVHAGAWAGAAASVRTSQTAVQQAALVSAPSQQVTVNAAAPATTASGGGGSTTTVRNTPDPYAPTINATVPCLVPITGGLVVAGFGGSIGSGTLDGGCELRETARLLNGIGQQAAAARILCNNRMAAAALGPDVCPQQQGPAASGAPCWQDEIIAKRLGAPICDTEREQ